MLVERVLETKIKHTIVALCWRTKAVKSCYANALHPCESTGIKFGGNFMIANHSLWMSKASCSNCYFFLLLGLVLAVCFKVLKWSMAYVAFLSVHFDPEPNLGRNILCKKLWKTLQVEQRSCVLVNSTQTTCCISCMRACQCELRSNMYLWLRLLGFSKWWPFWVGHHQLILWYVEKK